MIRSSPALHAVTNLEAPVRPQRLLLVVALVGGVLPFTATSAEAQTAAQGFERFNLRAHSQYHTATFSPDGKYVAASNAQKQVVFWDANSGQEVMLFNGHRAEIIDVAFSPDGKWLAASGREGARVWNVATGQEAFVILNKGYLSRVAFSPDSKHLAAVGSGLVTVWDVNAGQETRVVRTNVQHSSVAFSADGRFLAAGSTDRTIRIWSTQDLQQLALLREHTSAVHTVAFSPDGKRLASASVDRTVRLFDAVSGAVLLKLTGHQGGVNAVAFSPDGRHLASGGVDRTVKLWDLRTGQELLTLKGHTGPVYSVAFHRNGRRLVSTGSDATVRVWDVRLPPEPPLNLLLCDLEFLWDELASDQPDVAFKAMYALAAAPEQTSAFMKGRIKPAPVDPEEAERLQRLLADLDAPYFAVRQKATQQLEQLGRRMELALLRAQEERPSLEMSHRLDRLLTRLRGSPLSPEELFAERAVELLERIDTAAARDLLQSLAKGAPDSWLTREARAALRRQTHEATALPRPSR